MSIILAVFLIIAAAFIAYCVGYISSLRRSALSIAEHEQVQTQLRKLTSAVEQSPSTVMITDLQGRIEYVNPKFTALTGYTLDEVRGCNPRILNSGHTPQEVYADMWQTIIAGGEWRGEFLNKKKNGDYYWEYASISGVANADGKITHYIAVKEDITARKHAEEELRRNEAKTEAILSVIPDLVFRFTRDGICLDVHGSQIDSLLVGAVSAEDAVGKSIYDLLPESQARMIHETIVRTLDSGALQTVDYSLEIGQGHVDFEARMVVIGEDEVISVARDVTDRRRLEVALHASEVKYRSVAERANDAIAIIQDGMIRYANPQLSHMLGWEIGAIVNRSFEHFIAQEALDQVRSNYERRMRGEPVVTRYETRLLHSTGDPLDVEVNSSVFSYEGRPAVLAFIRDITARKQAESDREHLIEELDAFAHTVAHDLKSPLHGLIGYASLLADGLDSFSREELIQHLGTIERYGFKMNNIIDDLLLLSSVRSLNEVAIEPIDMALIVEGALARLDYLVDEQQAQVTYSGIDTWPRASGYAPWVEQAWVNYLSNALKYGGEPPQITLGADMCDDGFVRFWVRDRGPGITPEDQQRLFRDFSRVGEMKVEGHGLGLSIVQRIIKRLGGTVGVNSTVGEGAEFYFTLPAAEPAIDRAG